MNAAEKENPQPGRTEGSEDAHETSAGAMKHTDLRPDFHAARRFLALLDQNANEAGAWHFRVIHPDPAWQGKRAMSFSGAFDDVADALLAANAQGYGVFVVVNEGGHEKANITRARAVFADFDKPGALDALLKRDPGALNVAGVLPNIVVASSDGRHHVYWLLDPADPLPVPEFTDMQKRIAANFGSDASVNDASRLMRLPGFLHRKPKNEAAKYSGEPFLTRMYTVADRIPHSRAFTATELGAAFHAPPVPTSATGFVFSEDTVHPSYDRQMHDGPLVVTKERHADVLRMAARVSRDVVWEGTPHETALDYLKGLRDAGRWDRDVDDEELKRALDGAVEKFRSSEWSKPETLTAGPTSVDAFPQAANDPFKDTAAARIHELARDLAPLLTPATDEEWAAAATPDPHLFGDGETGLFPIGEATVLGAPPRAGKTTLMVHLATQVALGRTVVGLPSKCGRVVIYSREDDRRQYTRKLRAACSQLSPQDAARARAAVIVPNLRAPGIREASALIDICEKRRRPIETPVVDALVRALRPHVECDDPVRLLVFETASTLSHAEEDNKGLGALAAALKKIAQDLGVAVVMTHHLSQEGTKALQSLDLTPAVIRGATALIGDTRQILLLVDLGSEEEPFPDSDQREVWRRYLQQSPFNPHRGARLSALVPLDTSKARDPLPLVTAWCRTDDGPAMTTVALPEQIEQMRWRRMRGVILAWGAAQAKKAKGDRQTTTANAEIEEVVAAYRMVVDAGGVPTANAIAKVHSRGKDFVAARLAAAVKANVFTTSIEQVHRGPPGGTMIYTLVEHRDAPADSTNAV